MTQAGLSLLIKELENQIGFRLFNRTTRQVTLTNSGAKFFPIATRHLEQLDTAIHEISDLSAEQNKWVSIGAPPMTCMYFLSHAISVFKKKHRNYQIQLYDGDLLQIADKVSKGELDLGLGMYLKSLPDVNTTVLMKFPLYALQQIDDVNHNVSTLTWAALTNETLIALPPENPFQQLISKTLTDNQRIAPPEFVVNYIGTQIALAEAGQGIAIVPGWIAKTRQSSQVSATKLVSPVVEVNLSLIQERGKESTKASQAFIKFLQRHAIDQMGSYDEP